MLVLTSESGQKVVVSGRPPQAVLAVTTLTSGSIAAVQRAADWARAFDATLHVLYVMGPKLRSHMLFPQRHLADIFEHHLAVEVLLELVQQWVKNIIGQWLPREQIVVAEGNVSDQIVSTALALDANFIVMGLPCRNERGQRGCLNARRINRIVRRSHKPVLIARSQAAATHVLAATDLTNPAYPALHYARSLAVQVGAELTFLHHVYPSYASFTALPFADLFPIWPIDVLCLRTHDARARMHRLAADFGVGINIVVLEGGDTANQILAEANVRHADMIVLGSHKTGLFQSWLQHQVGVDVIEKATASILIVPIELN